MIILILNFVLLSFPALSVNLTELKISQSIAYPKLYRDNIPQKVVKKPLHQGYVNSIEEINFELSNYLYVRNGSLYGEQAYNKSHYEKFSQHCQLTKTDLKIKQFTQINMETSTKESLLVQRDKLGENGELATYYVVLENNQILPIDILVSDPYFGLSLEQIDFGEANLKFIKRQPIKLQPEPQSTEQINILYLQNLYIITKSNIYVHDSITNKITTVKGYESKGYVIESKFMEINQQTNNPLFYVLTSQTLDIYEIINSNQIQIYLQFDEFSKYQILAGLYDSGYFYLTSVNTLFIINFEKPKEYTIGIVPVNGSCIDIQKFQSTLHLSCVFNKIHYISEFFTFGENIAINRFFKSDDITGKVLARRIGQSKMAIITDSSIKIQAFGFNKNVLIEHQELQPEFTFQMKLVTDLIPIPKASKNKTLSSIALFQSKLVLLKIQQKSPQLNCQFSTDTVGYQYQVLMKFNTSRCSFVQNEEDLLYGNTETVCEVSIPVLIQTKQIVIKDKSTNFIQVALIIASLVMGLFCCTKCNRNIEQVFEKMKKSYEKAKQVYGKNAKAEI